MNASKIIVRLDAEQRTAELEIRTLHAHPRAEGLSEALRDHGIRLLCTVELNTPKFRVTRSRVASHDGATLLENRVLQILDIARNLQVSPALLPQRRVA